MLIRGISVLLGLGLLIVWVVALADHQPAWITWLEFIAGSVMLVQAVLPEPAEAMAASVLSLGLFALWIVALAVGDVAAWLRWTTLGFAIAYLAFAGWAAWDLRQETRVTTHT